MPPTLVLEADSGGGFELALADGGTLPVQAAPIAAGGVAASYVIYRPGGVDGAPYVATTFAELQAAVTAGAAAVYVDSSLGAATIPAGQTLAAPNGGTITLYSFNGVQGNIVAGTADTLTIADTGAIANLVQVLGGLILICTCLTAPALTYSQSGLRLVNRGGNVVKLAAGATVPAYTNAAGDWEAIAEYTAEYQGLAAVPLFECAGGLVILLFAFDSLPQLQVLGQSGGTAIIAYDSSCNPPLQTNGSVTVIQLSSDQQQAFGSGAAFPATRPGGNPLGVGQPFFRTDQNVEYRWNGAAWVIPTFQNTTTAGRPVATTVGQMDFDTTLGIPIWWNGAAWVNSVGVPV